MTIFVDSSALYAVVDSADENHAAASEAWRRFLQDESGLTTTNYVLLETSALLQRRFGMQSTREFYANMAPLLQVHWITERDHDDAVRFVVMASRRKLSLVDCSSFVVMGQMGITNAFCFDKHFAEQGFNVLPA